MVSSFTKDMAGPKSRTSDMYNHAREIFATNIFAASESFNICLLARSHVQTDLKKVGGNATGLANIKIAAVSMLVGEEYSSKILKRLPFSNIFKGWFLSHCFFFDT